jgi:hypothetical protein
MNISQLNCCDFSKAKSPVISASGNKLDLHRETLRNKQENLEIF